jgi:CDP-paratose synthetase
MKKILITGATGFVGKTLVPFLHRNGFEDLCVVVRNVSKTKKIFTDNILSDLTVVDSTLSNWQEKVVAYNPDVVIHMATCPNHRNDAVSINEVVNTNILFSSLILEAVSHTNCRCFINVGTFSEYLYENDIFFPNNFYSASKTALRPILQLWQTLSGWKWINVIPYSPYGRYNEITKVFDLLYKSLYIKEPLPFSKGEQVLDFIHVDDIANFFLQILMKLELFEEKYTQLYLGTGKGTSILELAKVFEKVTGRKANAVWGALPYRPYDTMHAIAPVEKNPTFFDWRNQISLEEGIKIYIDDIKSR